MSEAEPDKRTILDYLNEDCWRALLKYVPVKDIICSERVSRQWQNNILVYLSDISIGIGHNPHFRDTNKVRWLILNRGSYLSFKSWTDKLGSSVVACSNCGPDILKIVVENCPNLTSVTILVISDETKLNNDNECLRKLKQIHINTCCDVSDNCISQFITSEDLEELDLVWCSQLTGQFLTNLKSTNIKSLGFTYCQSLSFRYLLSVVNRLSNLTKLELFAVDKEISEKLYLLLDKCTKLEHLDFDSHYIRCDDFFNAVCSLSNLRLLVVNYYVRDEDLEAVMRCCQELETLDLGNCYAVTGRGLACAIAQAGARLTALGARGSRHLTDSDVAACVRACPNLGSLDVSRSHQLTPAAAALAAAARGRLRAQGSERTLLLDLSECPQVYSCDELPDDDYYKEDGLMLTFDKL